MKFLRINKVIKNKKFGWSRTFKKPTYFESSLRNAKWWIRKIWRVSYVIRIRNRLRYWWLYWLQLGKKIIIKNVGSQRKIKKRKPKRIRIIKFNLKWENEAKTIEKWSGTKKYFYWGNFIRILTFRKKSKHKPIFELKS